MVDNNYPLTYLYNETMFTETVHRAPDCILLARYLYLQQVHRCSLRFFFRMLQACSHTDYHSYY
jgi:hypothetical protein